VCPVNVGFFRRVLWEMYGQIICFQVADYIPLQENKDDQLISIPYFI
jgi:hypothetical protein